MTLDQVNRQIDILDTVQNQVAALQSTTAFTQQQSAIADPAHAPSTTNNLSFSWNGGTGVVTWNQGFIKDKNWNAQTTSTPAVKSSAPGAQHIFSVPSGTLSLSPSTYYWIGWDHTHQQMVASSDASQLHGNYNVHVICKLYTGTSMQTGTAGGGGSTGGVDLSGLTYKNF